MNPTASDRFNLTVTFVPFIGQVIASADGNEYVVDCIRPIMGCDPACDNPEVVMHFDVTLRRYIRPQHTWRQRTWNKVKSFFKNLWA